MNTEECFKFLCDTPSCSRTTDAERIREYCTKKRLERIDSRPSSTSAVERSRKYRAKKRLERNSSRASCTSVQPKSNAERMRAYRAKKGTVNKKAKSKAERMRAYRAKKGTVSKEAKSNAERMRAYRAKKDTVSTQAKSNAERMRVYRAKKSTVSKQANAERTRKRKNAPLSNTERALEFRLRKKLRLSMTEEDETCERNQLYVPPPKCLADVEFEKRFTANPFGFTCAVCDRLWFKEDLRPAPLIARHVLRNEFPNENVSAFRTCNNCYRCLSRKKIPRLSRSNGFRYPPIPSDLPPLDPITERLISPRLPFMQIRRLRFVKGSKAIVGQVINVPVDVNNMVLALPRQLDDDYAFNVHIKKHLIHKSSAYSGFVKKRTVKAWLRYLVNTPLYREHGVTVDASFLRDSCDPEDIQADYGEDNENDLMIEPIENEPSDVKSLLMAKQHTILWDEEKYLSLAPGMNRPVVALGYDEHAEELSFPGIYLGVGRKFNQRVYDEADDECNDDDNDVDSMRQEIFNTVYAMATSEIRRTDRRGVKPEHILYMAMRVMRLRLTDGMRHVFKTNSCTKTLTVENMQDKELMESMVEQNFAFLKSIPNSVHYWASRKKDVFAMIRQLGKPTLFLTLSASEYEWNDLLRLLYRLENNGREWTGEGDPETSMSSDLRTTLVNEDPVTCCLYFNKLVDTIMFILSKTYSPFGKYRVVDWFKRIEFQQRGSPHAHILMWLANDPKEDIGEDMFNTVALIDALCRVDVNQLEKQHWQTHKHTFTCYKKCTHEENKVCRFGAPFWPMKNTRVLLPMPKDDGRRKNLSKIYEDMHRGLEFGDFNSLDSLWLHHNIRDEEHYLNVLRAGITRPRIFLRRTMQEKWLNNFHPWLVKTLRSNMDIQIVLEEFSCASYVVEYVNKTNRGFSNLNCELSKLRDEYPDLDFAQLATKAGTRLLDSVEMSCQEAAWYLLNLHMSEASRKCEYIPTVWPQERHRVRKTQARMEKEDLPNDSTDIWCENNIEKYESRPEELGDITLAQFTAWYYKKRNGEWQRRKIPKVIRYVNYEPTKKDDYRREQCLLHVPFKNEELDLLDCHRYRQLYEARENDILEARKEFESRIDIDCVLAECQRLFIEDEESEEVTTTECVTSETIQDDFVRKIRDSVNEDMVAQVMERMSAVVRKRENTLTAEQYCEMMRRTNMLQRELVLEIIHRIFIDGKREHLQIFLTGPAGCGKTYTMKAMMETYNRFSRTRNSIYNAYVASASTGVTAAAIGGSTVHSAFRISNNSNTGGLKTEMLNQFRAAFADIWAVFVDECSMIGAKLLSQIDSRMKQIFHEFNTPFAGKDMIFCGDLRQLPAVRQIPIYKRTTLNFASDSVWQTLQYYPLDQVMRQSNIFFSGVLTKIGNGDPLNQEEVEYLEARFVDQEVVNRTHPMAIRLFHTNDEINEYHANVFEGASYDVYIAVDSYAGARTTEQLASARTKVHKMKIDETGGLPYKIELLLDKPYMVRVNIDVADGIVNGSIGLLKYIERSQESDKIVRLWLKFDDVKIGKLLRSKAAGHYIAHPCIDKHWTPISLRSSTVTLPSKIITCKRSTFPVTPACAISIHKSQGSTYPEVVYEYSKSHDQQLVYVALSRCSSYEGLFLTNKRMDHRFYHSRGRFMKEIRTEFERLQHHPLRTHASSCRDFVNLSRTRSIQGLTLCSLNVQSLRAHFQDLVTDSVIPLCGILTISETWLSDANCDGFILEGYSLINRHKRDNGTTAGGVAIYERILDSQFLNSCSRSLIRVNEEKNCIEYCSVLKTDIGDICKAETTIDGQRVIIIAVYLSNQSTLEEKTTFLGRYLQPYFRKWKGVNCIDELKLHEVPILLCGDFNIDFRSKEGLRFRQFVEETFGCELTNTAEVSTTRNMTCVDGIFSRNIENVRTLAYVSYFSHHRPLITVNTP